MVKKVEPYVGQHECSMFAAMADQVATGLNCVLLEGVLPENYQEVFKKAALFLREIVEVAYHASNHNNPCREHITEKSGATIWFSNLASCYPEIYEGLNYGDVADYADTLEELAKDEVLAYAYPEDWISSIQTFFFMLSFATAEECLKEKVSVACDVATHLDGNKKVH